MSQRKYVIESAGTVGQKTADGVYRVVLITEGSGSTGDYSGDLIDRSEHVWENSPSFLNHPIDPSAPHLRPVESIAGRFSNVVAEDGPLGRQLAADFKPRNGEVAAFVEEFWDIIGLSIFCSAEGEIMEDGRIRVEEFDATDPYRSVDIVVAAGRGGRFKRAQESLRVIESSLGMPVQKPAAEASAEEKEGENHMDKEILDAIKALAEDLKPLVASVNESIAKKAEESQAKVDAEAIDTAVAEALESYEEKIAAIDAAELLAPQVEALKARARKGEDITDGITEAKAVVEAARTAVAPSEGATSFVIESAATKGAAKHDWTL